MKKSLALLTLLAASPALADTISVAGHKVETAENADALQTLVVDGQVLLEDDVIYLDATAEQSGGSAIITGSSGAGGNACNPVPFVLHLVPGKAPQLDRRPGDNCDYFEPQVGDGTVTFASTATAAQPGERWIWTAGKGFSGPAATYAKADPSKGWNDLSGLENAHPLDVFNYGEIHDQMIALLGETETDSFMQAISDIGSGSLKPPGYVGSACDKFDCQASYGVLILDSETRQPYLAWSLFGSEIMTRPEGLENWSPAAIKALKEWSAQH